MTRARDLADSADKDIAGTLTLDGLTVAGNVSADGGTIKLDGNYPVGTGNVALGNTALDSVTTGEYNTAVGDVSLTANTTGVSNVSLGAFSMENNVGGNYNTSVGVLGLRSNTSGANNTGLGYGALRSNTTASNNTAVGYQAGYSNTTGTGMVAIGRLAGYSNSTAAYNTFVGETAGYTNSTGASNTALGNGSMYDNTTGANNVAVGQSALANNTTASWNTAVGYQTGYANTTGLITAFGSQALNQNTTGVSNVAIGGYTTGTDYAALFWNTTGSYNTAIGSAALQANTTANNNTSVGYQALYANTTGAENVAIGSFALDSNTTGTGNVAIGYGAGNAITTGTKNTIIGAYDGNQGGLDIRTSSNNIVLSDGDGNPRIYVKSSGATGLGGNSQVSALAHFDGGGTVFADYNNGNYGATVIGAPTGNYGSIGYGWAPTHTGFDYSNNDYASRITFNSGGIQVWTAAAGTAGNTINWSGGPYVTQGNGSWTTYSDERLKNITGEIQNGLEKVSQLRAAYYSLISDPDATPRVGVIAQDVQTVLPEAVSVGTADTTAGTEQLVSDDLLGVQYDNLIPLLIAALKEAKTKIETLEAKVTALENP